ncbi:uncharacterized protein LOC109792204 [Cajanus cajan]|uniref:uncharacterized protein LOC109792204 n=1 Tax=Cajanus cajan TaxID=3821 RepID=UPI00098D88E2|nr:uncharacterized protein LOC109792204 [Cajanus cajan]
MLMYDADFWWERALQRMMVEATLVNWGNFKRVFLGKYFLDDVRSQKEVKFLELRQEDGTVAEYVAKFDELVCYCSCYHGEGGERAKCIKFMNDLHLEVTTMINYQKIYHYPSLVDKCRIYNRDNRAHPTFYKGVGPVYDGRFNGRSRSKPYSALVKFQRNRARGNESKSVVGSSFVSGATSVGGSISILFGRCKKCGQHEHEHYNCPNKEITCFNYNGKGLISN